MNIDDQILKLNEFSIVFLSETLFVVTNDLDKTLKTEKVIEIDVNKKIRKTKFSVGTNNLNIRVKSGVINVFIHEKRILLKELINTAQPFEKINLDTNSKYISYSKNNNTYVSLPINNFIHLNQPNVLLKNTLGNIIYLRDMKKDEFVEMQKVLSKLSVPMNYFIFNNKILEEEHKNIIYKNDLSPSNNFYFIDDIESEINSTGAKQVLTYGFSRNNTLNYFDINMSNNFNELRTYINSNFNYNKNYFNKELRKDKDVEYLLRQLQFNTFLPVSFCDLIEMNKIPLNEDDENFKISLKYLKLRHRLIPLLYGAFKEKRIKNIDVYQNFDGQILFNKQLMYIPISNYVDKVTKQEFLKINFEDIYYDFQTEEKYIDDTHQFYNLATMPIFAKSGAIIPLAVLSNDINKNTEYEIKIYPNNDNEYTLYYEEFVKSNNIIHTSTLFQLDYAHTKMLLRIKPNAPKDFLPNVFHLNFINIRHTSIVKVEGSTFKVDYNMDKKYLLVDIFDTNKEVIIEITNPIGLEIDRSVEFFNNKLEKLFNNMNLNEKEYNLYKYKVRPYLHESLESIESRIDKHFKFINAKQRKNITKMLEPYKK